jgi:ABC-type transport system involved in multi-copper enzyme maturation permease subunit
VFSFYKIIWFELKKIFTKKSIYISVCVLLVLLCSLINQVIKADQHIDYKNFLHLMNNFFLSYMLILITFQSALIITEEFKFGTCSFLFTKNRSRTSILITKFLAIICLSIIMAAINCIVIIYYMSRLHIPILFKTFFDLVISYIFYSGFLCSFAFIFALLIKHTLSSFISSLFFNNLIGDLTRTLHGKLGLSNKYISYNPFCNLNLPFVVSHLNSTQAIIMFTITIIFFIISSLILEKQDLY